MLFPTVAFAAFFSVIMPLSRALMARPVAWKLFILVASYVFHATANWKFCLLLARQPGVRHRHRRLPDPAPARAARATRGRP
jgi:hypothetical protein